MVQANGALKTLTVGGICAVLLALASSVNAVQADSESRAMGSGPSANFVVASFNVLGADHTDKKGGRKGFDKSGPRMNRGVDLVKQHDLDLIGFQELQPTQMERFLKRSQWKYHDQWAVFPGDRFHVSAMHNSIGWRADVWEPVRLETIESPYFKGNMLRMPYVLLRHRATGQLLWMYNSHQPADTRGPAKKWRYKATTVEIKLINRLRKQYPMVPIISTGDKNQREGYYCRVAAKTLLNSAGGGYSDGDTCVLPPRPRVDWLMGSPDISFTNYQERLDSFTRSITDHPLIVADANVTPELVRARGVDRVVIVNVSGLPSWALSGKRGRRDAPKFTQMRQESSSTLSARTQFDRTNSLANVAGMITGLQANPNKGGHGWGWSRKSGAAKESLFDLVHDRGKATAFLSSNESHRRLVDAWGAGANDTRWPNHGRAKIDVGEIFSADNKVMKRFEKLVSHEKAPVATVITLDKLRGVGAKHGWSSPAWKAALKRTDNRIGRVKWLLSTSPAWRGRSLLIVTSDHGAYPGDPSNAKDVRNFKVPLLAHEIGGTVSISAKKAPLKGSLYATHDRYDDLGKERGRRSDRGAIRTQVIANMAAAWLGLPPLRQGFSSDQSLTGLAPR